MINNKVTYGQLERVLSKLDFSMKKVKPHWKCYEHAPSDTVIIFADEKPSEPALPSVVLSARIHLIDKGLINEAELDKLLTAASPP